MQISPLHADWLSLLPKRVLSALALAMTAALVLAACGGNDEPTLNELLEASADDGDLDIDLPGLDLEIDGDDDSNVSFSTGDVDTAMGTDLDRPDWLEAAVQLPDGLAINLAINDASTGERVIQGLIDGDDAEAVIAEQTAMLESIGYEALQDSGYFVKDGVPPVRIQIGATGDGSLGYTYEHSFESEQTLRDVYAAVEATGTLTAWIDGQVLSWQGACTLRSTSGQFAADNGEASLTIEERDGEQDYILGNITQTGGDSFSMWNILQVNDDGSFPTVSVRPDSFQFDGNMVDQSFANPTRATLEVKCPG